MSRDWCFSHQILVACKHGIILIDRICLFLAQRVLLTRTSSECVKSSPNILHAYFILKQIEMNTSIESGLLDMKLKLSPMCPYLVVGTNELSSRIVKRNTFLSSQ